MSKKVVLACKECGSRNYTSMSREDLGRLEINKFCSTCNTHTVHRETK